MAKTYIEQLAEHIKKNLKKGYTLDALKISLIGQGYSRISIEKAIELLNKQLANEIPLMKEKPQITYKIIADNEEIKINHIKGFWSWLKSLFQYNI